MQEENKMGVMPVNKLLINMALPMVISMLVQALYNIVDSIYVSRIPNFGEEALAAVGLAFPVQMLLIAFSNGTAVGVNSILSRALGERDTKTVQKVAHNGIFMALVCFVLFLVVGLFLAKPIIAGQGASGVTYDFGYSYLTIVCVFSFGLFMQIMLERLLQSTGRTFYSMITQTTGAVINIVLDPIFIFGWFGLPEFRVAGAAIATIVGQIIAACLALFFNLKNNKDIELHIHSVKPDIKMIGQIYKVGFPAIIMQSIGSIMVFCMNRILYTLDDAAVSVFTVYFKIQSLFFMPTIGISNGMIPIIAYNYGAGKRSRLIKTIKLGMMYAFFALLIGFLAFELVPGLLLDIFKTDSGSLAELGVPALRIIGTHFLVAWFCIISGTVFQSLGNGIYSMIVSLARQLFVLVPVAYLLAKIGGLPLVWWSFPIAEIMSLLGTTIFMVIMTKQVINHIPDNV